MRFTPLLFCLLLIVLLNGCDVFNKQTDWSVTLYKEDKKPYGAYLAYHSLTYFFPSAYIEALPHSYRFSSMSRDMKYNENGTSLMILSGLDFKLSKKEWYALKEFVKNGNELLLFCSNLDPLIAKYLDVRTASTGGEEMMNWWYLQDTLLHKNLVRLANADKKEFSYKGRSLQGCFETGGWAKNLNSFAEFGSDTGYDDEKTDYYSAYAERIDTALEDPTPEILGYVGEEPNCLRYHLGKGHMTIHAAPLTISNYFLLQGNNIDYLAGILNKLPSDINRIYWNDYYKRQRKHSSLAMLFRYKATRAALILVIFLVLMFLLFEIKRRQRIIPVIPPIRNDSVIFVETVGRLYYNKGDHTNLAEKMIQQFFEWVRNYYFLNTNVLNEEFIQALTVKSGIRETEVRELMSLIQDMRTVTKPDEVYIFKMHKLIQAFYNTRGQKA